MKTSAKNSSCRVSLKEFSMKLSQIVALSRDNKSRSWCPVMTNAQLTQFFGNKPSRDLVIQRMEARRTRNIVAAS
jgi:hypothetical protein